MTGKPVHYVRALGAGLGAAAVGGVLLAQLFGTVAFGTLIASGFLGFVIGRAVVWGTQGQTQQPFAAVAVGCALLSVGFALALAYGTPVPPGLVWRLLAYPVAGWLALRGLQS